MEKYLNFPLLILSAFLIRPIYSGASIGDALVLISLSSLYGVYYYLENKKSPVANQELINRIVELEESIRITKESIHSIKLGTSFKR